MTSEEKHKIRYQRRKKRREEKRKQKSENCGNFEQVFSYENLYQAGRKCMRGVLWKASSQNYIRKQISNTYDIYEKLQTKKFKFSNTYTFKINERGKEN